MIPTEKISAEQLYKDAKKFEKLSWENPNYSRAGQEFEATSPYKQVGKGKYRSVFYREDLPGEEETVVKFPHRVSKPEESNQHNLDEYQSWNTMKEDMKNDFAKVIDCGDNGEYLVQRKSEGRNLFGAVKLMLTYHFSGHPSDDIGLGNIGVLDGKDVILDYAWGEM